MEVWNSMSTERKKCAICGRKTGNYKVYEQTNISITIPTCDECYRKVDVSGIADASIKLIRQAIEISKG